MNATFELIPLVVKTRGEVIQSNVGEFRQLVREALSTINRDLKSDDDFGRAEQDAKRLKGAEDAVKQAKAKALADAQDLQALFAELDGAAEEIRQARLDLDRQISKRKVEVKAEMIADAMGSIDCAPRLRERFARDLAVAQKGKRTIDTIRAALNDAVAGINDQINEARIVLATFAQQEGTTLIPDRDELELRNPESLDAELRRRVDNHRAEQERQRLRAEAEQARRDAEDARRAQATPCTPAPAPDAPAANVAPPRADEPPPRIGFIPVGGSRETVDQEWARFRDHVMAAFAPLKDARANLKHSANQVRAMLFAKTVTEAWRQAQNPVLVREEGGAA